MLSQACFLTRCAEIEPRSFRSQQAKLQRGKRAPEAQADEGVAAGRAVDQLQRKVPRAVHHGLYGLPHRQMPAIWP